MGRGYDTYYAPSKPIETTEGIKASSKKGQFGANWWSKKWIEALESFHDSARLQRGRTYARRGQVLSIDILQGKVRGKVLGSRAKPYEVLIEVDTLSQERWRQIIEVLSLQAFFAAKLLSGEMPQDIETIFEEANCSLLPNSHHQLQTDCSCPDWSNPCKHVAAVYYLLGEEFDRDPFLIFALRGMTREAFLRHLETQTVVVDRGVEEESEELFPLSLDEKAFWGGEPLQEAFDAGEFNIPLHSATLTKSLGKFPFWRGHHPLQTKLEAFYKKASNAACSMLVDE